MESAAIDPDRIPMRTLASGATMPAIGFGTFGSDHVDHGRVAGAVQAALRVGYRHLDCAAVYGNERTIGEVLAASSLPRDDLWVSSKVWNDRHDDVAGACEATLRDLQLDHLDNYLVHWPFPNHHDPHVDVTARHRDAVAFSAERYLDTWGQMEALVDRGLTRHIGTSNMTAAKLDAVWDHLRITPAVNQMELHPHFQQPALSAYLKSHGVEPIGFCPLGSPGRPTRDRTPEDSSPIDDPTVTELAHARGVHPAAICISWAVTNGHTPIPFSTSPINMAANLRAALDPLTDAEMGRLTTTDRGCRLIKGQVFLWREGQDWRDLWDEDGTIAG